MARTLLLRTNDQRSLENLSTYIEYLNDQHKGKQVEYIVEIKKNRPIRSVSANRFYWAILKDIASHTGYREDEMHEFFKKKFNSKTVLNELIGESTSNLDSKEFSTYCKQVKDYAKEMFDLIIPDPSDRHYAVWEQITHEKYNAMYNSI